MMCNVIENIQEDLEKILKNNSRMFDTKLYKELKRFTQTIRKYEIYCDEKLGIGKCDNCGEVKKLELVKLRLCKDCKERLERFGID